MNIDSNTYIEGLGSIYPSRGAGPTVEETAGWGRKTTRLDLNATNKEEKGDASLLVAARLINQKGASIFEKLIKLFHKPLGYIKVLDNNEHVVLVNINSLCKRLGLTKEQIQQKSSDLPGLRNLMTTAAKHQALVEDFLTYADTKLDHKSISQAIRNALEIHEKSANPKEAPTAIKVDLSDQEKYIVHITPSEGNEKPQIEVYQFREKAKADLLYTVTSASVKHQNGTFVRKKTKENTEEWIKVDSDTQRTFEEFKLNHKGINKDSFQRAYEAIKEKPAGSWALIQDKNTEKLYLLKNKIEGEVAAPSYLECEWWEFNKLQKDLEGLSEENKVLFGSTPVSTAHSDEMPSMESTAAKTQATAEGLLGVKFPDSLQEIGRGAQSIAYVMNEGVSVEVTQTDVKTKMVAAELFKTLDIQTSSPAMAVSRTIDPKAAETEYSQLILIHKQLRENPDQEGRDCVVQQRVVTDLRTKQQVVVAPYYEGGDLYNELADPQKEVSVEYAINILRDVAKGMAFLHDSEIIHRDLAARNIFLRDKHAAVSDFGMAKIIPNGDVSITTPDVVGPLKWMAPESLAQRIWSKASDVWSFGVVMMELFTRDDPYPGMSATEVAIKVARTNPDYAQETAKEILSPLEIDPKMKEILIACFNKEPYERPSMGRILQVINDCYPE